ncbi:response regulator transcription factor [Massilia sp. H-1]|nr:response regulator transcription factor [Massilia sp. H-1]
MREGLKRILDGALDIDIVGEAINGFEVLSHVRQGGFDLLLLDLSMPGRSGVDLIRQIRSEAPKLAILILTMHEEEQYAVCAICAAKRARLPDQRERSKHPAGGRDPQGGLGAALHQHRGGRAAGAQHHDPERATAAQTIVGPGIRSIFFIGGR